MRRESHTRTDRLLIAQVIGAVAKHATLKPDVFEMNRAVMEVLSITGDPHLLGHAWAYPNPIYDDPWVERKNEILVACNAERPEDAP